MTESSTQTVAVSRCDSYYRSLLLSLLRKQFLDAGITKEMICGRKVAIKPNLVVSKGPEAAATTHPEILAAVTEILRDYGPASLILAESPGGPYTDATLKSIYRACGISRTAEEIGLDLNYDCSFEPVRFAAGKTARSFNIINPINEADVIVNLCKLKTHSLMKMTCAVKNFFGVIPGVQKFEMHAKYSHVNDFGGMLVDLCEYLCENKKVITVCDGILAMEGNGPSFGVPRKMDILMTSLSPFAIDVVAEHVIGFDDTVLTTKIAAERNICPSDIGKINLIGDDIEQFRVADFLEPDSKSGKFLKELPNIMGGRLASFFEPRPKINTKKCVGCGRCAKSCPMQTIKVVGKDGKRHASINKRKCIKCYCCQELCPFDAVDTKQNILIKIVH